MIGFRASEPKDAHYLLDIDIKCFDYAWLPSDWRIVAQHCVACVTIWNGRHIGMAIFGKNADGDVQVVKLAVKSAYRHRGIATGLMRNYGLSMQRDSRSTTRAVGPRNLALPRSIPVTSADGWASWDFEPISRSSEINSRSTVSPRTVSLFPTHSIGMNMRQTRRQYQDSLPVHPRGKSHSRKHWRRSNVRSSTRLSLSA